MGYRLLHRNVDRSNFTRGQVLGQILAVGSLTLAWLSINLTDLEMVIALIFWRS